MVVNFVRYGDRRRHNYSLKEGTDMSLRTRGRHVTGAGASIISSSTDEVRDLIARRAYELYEQRADGPGNELADWLTAEREVSAMLTAPAEVASEAMPASSPAQPKNGARRITASGATTKVKGPSKRKSNPKNSPARP